jgi:hypothetical protein
VNEKPPVRNSRISDAEKEQMIEAYRIGKTIRRIMRETGRSYGGVYETLINAGVEMRPTGREAPDTERWARDGS